MFLPNGNLSFQGKRKRDMHPHLPKEHITMSSKTLAIVVAVLMILGSAVSLGGTIFPHGSTRRYRTYRSNRRSRSRRNGRDRRSSRCTRKYRVHWSRRPSRPHRCYRSGRSKWRVGDKLRHLQLTAQPLRMAHAL